MNMTRVGATVLVLSVSTSALTQPGDHRLGEHPAVIVKRMYEREGYDYASKFYPHPAWLHLLSEAPRQMFEHPAVLVFRRHLQEAQRCAATLEPTLNAELPR
jgi:hypothetical protein